jgi:large subunit ribosomal protein L22
VARDIEKVLRSAIANATLKEGFGGDVERLFIDACYANQGPSQKRIRPAPMGRAFRVVKRTAHLTVRVAEKPSKVTAGSPGEGAAKRPRRATPKSKTSPKRPKAAKAGATSAKKKTTAKSRATAATE